MGLSVSLEKVEEARDYVLYAFGGPETSAGRVRLYKASGDVELATLTAPNGEADQRYYLAQVVPRLQSYHDRNSYPDADRWEA